MYEHIIGDKEILVNYHQVRNLFPELNSCPTLKYGVKCRSTIQDITVLVKVFNDR